MKSAAITWSALPHSNWECESSHLLMQTSSCRCTWSGAFDVRCLMSRRPETNMRQHTHCWTVWTTDLLCFIYCIALYSNCVVIKLINHLYVLVWDTRNRLIISRWLVVDLVVTVMTLCELQSKFIKLKAVSCIAAARKHTIGQHKQIINLYSQCSRGVSEGHKCDKLGWDTHLLFRALSLLKLKALN